MIALIGIISAITLTSNALVLVTLVLSSRDAGGADASSAAVAA